MKKNKVILTVFGALFLTYLVLHAYSFEIRAKTDFWIIPTKLLMALTMIILLTFVTTKWWIKLLSIVAFFSFLLFGLQLTGIWKYSLHRYVEKEKSAYIKLANEIDKTNIDNLVYISCYNNRFISMPRLDSTKTIIDTDLICKYIEELDCIEVSLNQKPTKYLFVMSRFIDNGYGLLYYPEKHDGEDLMDERICGLELRSVIKVDDHWYYVSFT